MRQDVPRTRAVLTVLLAGAALLLCSAVPAAATPTLGADCGAGATIVGSDSAGKVTLGAGVSSCTLTFLLSSANAPACIAVNETNGGGNPATVAVKSTTTTAVIGGTTPIAEGDVISYICQSY